MAAAIQPVQLAMLACASRRAQRELKNWPCFALHGVDNKVHVTGREAGADPGFWAQKVSTCACSAYSGRESLGITSLGSGTNVAKWLRVYRAIGVRLLAVSLRLLLPKTFSGDNRTVVARRPHGGRRLICHHLPPACRFLNMFKNQMLNARSLVFT